MDRIGSQIRNGSEDALDILKKSPIFEFLDKQNQTSISVELTFHQPGTLKRWSCPSVCREMINVGNSNIE
ncbi:unnamed protein product [Sphenostylis stenocarpa]|uniref:Uncharacterized protein n=1 Tax=Sphenostylis stenocarpa TaxID=92480 RepID=A0AA86TES2_9FABA|nr:unnamed protein product [Sphenostylis stenocarpa]